MNRKLKHGMSMAVAMLSALFINTACTDEWDNHYNDNGTNGGKTSILDKIREDKDLADFCAVLDSMNVFDKNGKMFDFADSLFNQSRVYTLWAPVNGSFNKDSLLQELEAEFDESGRMRKPGRDRVYDRFVGSHVAEYMKIASDTLKEDNYILLINEKMVPFVGGKEKDIDNAYIYTFDGFTLTDKNIRASNGIIHKLEPGGYVNYLPNIWEFLETAKDADSVAKFLYSFDKREFDPYNSIEGPTVNGDKTYIDSAFTNSNQWLYSYGDKTKAGFGDISQEDSSYIVFVPSNRMWDEMVPKIEKYFRIHTPKVGNTKEEDAYNAAKATNDSLRNYYARKTLLNYMVFSQKDQPKPGADNHTALVRDSLLSTYKAGKRLFFAKNDLMVGVTADSAHLSNGTFYIKDVFNYNMFDLWHDTIKVEAESSAYQGVTFDNEVPKDFTKQGSAKGASWKWVSKDNIHWTDSLYKEKNKDLQYIELVGLVEATSQQSLTWTIPQVLSGSYNVGVVVVPPHIAEKDSSAHLDSKPNWISLFLKANEGAEGSNGKPKQIEKAEKLSNDPTRIDTVWMPDAKDATKRRVVKFDCCEYGLARDKFTVTLEVKNVVPKNTKTNNYDLIYDRRLRVDLIILEPVKDDE